MEENTDATKLFFLTPSIGGFIRRDAAAGSVLVLFLLLSTSDLVW
jgi:hypothetical protein